MGHFHWALFPKKEKERKEKIENLAWLFQFDSKSKLLEIHMNLSTCSIRQARWEPPINSSQVSIFFFRGC